MTGKAYQLREMKGIVEYLVEHKSYGEIKGRKIWMDFANSSATNRTWQSLKETFLKRILPDIHNPYYKLNRDQICSFQQFCDVQAKENMNRLEIRSASPDSKEIAAEEKNNEQPNTSNGNEGGNAAGMELKHAKITTRNRSSADTLILEGNSEVLETNGNCKNIEHSENAEDNATKSFKECLEFEPYETMTLVQKVLEDFVTESEESDDEPRMNIDENPKTNSKNDANAAEEEIDDLIILDHSESIEKETQKSEENVLNEEVEVSGNKNENLEASIHKVTENTDVTIEVTENVIENDNNTTKDAGEIAVSTGNCKNLTVGKTCNENQDSLSTTADTIIPNNQEVLNEHTDSRNKLDTQNPTPKDIVHRKRSISQDPEKSKENNLDSDIQTTKEFESAGVNITEMNPVKPDEAKFNALKKTDNYVDDCVPSTSKEVSKKDCKDQNKNPCLQSVSLFEEQFNTTKYSDSEVETPLQKSIENTEKNSKFDETDKQKNETAAEIDATDKIKSVSKIDSTVEGTADQNKKNEVVNLKSSSDTEKVRQIRLKRLNDPKRYKHLAKAFGFTTGPSVVTPRRRSIRSRNRRSKSQRETINSNKARSESSEWETSSGGEAYVSPPRGRRNRHARRYLKPESARIISLEEDGGLLVAHRNKIYPLVKDGRILKKFVTYDNGSGSEAEENSYWRQKYVEQKKATADLQKKLDQANAQGGSPRSRSPLLQSRNAPSSSCDKVPAPAELDMNKNMSITQKGDSGKIQITLAKNNEDAINLEGQWPQVLPILQQVMNMFYKPDPPKQENVHKDSEPKSNPTIEGSSVNKTSQNAQNQTDISGQTTPVIPVVDLVVESKVDDLETAIFKEIEEIDKADTTKDTGIVTKRAAKTKKTPSTSSDQSEPVKKQRKTRSKKAQGAAQTQEPETKVLDTNKVENAIVSSTDQESKYDKTKKSKEVVLSVEESDNRVGALEPIVTRTQAKKPRRSGNDTDSSARSVTTRLSSRPKPDSDDEPRYMLPPPPEPKRKSGKKAGSLENPHEISQNSIDSTQGYQDTDASPVITKRKRKVSLIVRKARVVNRRKSIPSNHELSPDSSNSSYFVPLKHQTTDSAVYNTESYQLLMPNRKSAKKLEAIDEVCPLESDSLRHFNAVSNSSGSAVIELGSSSTVSLPLSPELSIVENISITRDMIQNHPQPTINETQADHSVVTDIYNQYLMSSIDISLPLMQQECRLRNSQGNFADSNTDPRVNCTISNKELTDTLNKRLQDLLLESAKKMRGKDHLMDVDETNTETRAAKKKRCSTPQKRNAKKTKTKLNSVIEEHIESCSREGRTSCPPAISFVPIDENANNSSDVQLAKPKRKKDIIKVKIQRPGQKRKTDSEVANYTDSGINATESISQLIEPSDLELIHNHSETCLQVTECCGDSVQFLDFSKSIISLDSTVSLENELDKILEDVEMLSGYSRGVHVENEKTSEVIEEVFATPTNTEYHSPLLSNNSLLTEDLSDETPSPPSKWYLLSEEDTNTMRPDQMTSNTRVSNFSANLKQLFPITCAVPDLSTISEMSKENTKALESDGDTRSSDYQSLL